MKLLYSRRQTLRCYRVDGYCMMETGWSDGTGNLADGLESVKGHSEQRGVERIVSRKKMTWRRKSLEMP